MNTVKAIRLLFRVADLTLTVLIESSLLHGRASYTTAMGLRAEVRTALKEAEAGRR
jgi:hypothetical protein